ncbi:MAG: metalloregulator ArsR/SmtB family transcription factor [Alphaproteobacteria bacterium]
MVLIGDEMNVGQEPVARETVAGELTTLLAGLRAAGESTRLRLLALCAEGELTVSELTQILGQSQPRVSRHLKLLCEAGLLARVREGASVFYGLAEQGRAAAVARAVLDLMPANDPTRRQDARRLAAVSEKRREAAQRYFSDNAARWDAIRSLHVDEAEVERCLLGLLPPGRIGDHLDVGTGTGRMLALFAGRTERAVGIDLSRAMLSIARTNLERSGARHWSLRSADMSNLPMADASFDLVTIHQVLHFADRPADAIAEAARVLRADGLLLIVDFAPHDLEYLREEHAHRRLGFSDQQVREWCSRAGLATHEPIHLPGRSLTVAIWRARRTAVAGQAEAAE